MSLTEINNKTVTKENKVTEINFVVTEFWCVTNKCSDCHLYTYICTYKCVISLVSFYLHGSWAEKR
jgi:predicted acetyltransferase